MVAATGDQVRILSAAHRLVTSDPHLRKLRKTQTSATGRRTSTHAAPLLMAKKRATGSLDALTKVMIQKDVKPTPGNSSVTMKEMMSH